VGTRPKKLQLIAVPESRPLSHIASDRSLSLPQLRSRFCASFDMSRPSASDSDTFEFRLSYSCSWLKLSLV
jgi:hypothetical protein